MLRLSAQATYGGIGQSGFVTGGVLYTVFLDDAAVDSYVSPVLGVGLKLGSGSALRVGYRGDLGDGFDAHGGEIELRFAF